jgi:hypothetical protein
MTDELLFIIIQIFVRIQKSNDPSHENSEAKTKTNSITNYRKNQIKNNNSSEKT